MRVSYNGYYGRFPICTHGFDSRHPLQIAFDTMYNSHKTPKQVEDSLNALFAKYGLQEKITVDEIKKWIWNAKGGVMDAIHKYQKKCFELFPEPQSVDEFNNVMQTFTDAWNYFPHKELGGKAPNDLMREAVKNAPKDDPASNHMPKIIVGNQEMEIDEYEEMIREMEFQQKPFKKWIKKDALPKYKNFLKQIVKDEKKCEEHYDVADKFFMRVLHVGFLNLEQIRPDFIQKEFPIWWPTHIMYSKLKPKQVLESLKKFYDFAELVYGIDRPLI